MVSASIVKRGYVIIILKQYRSLTYQNSYDLQMSKQIVRQNFLTPRTLISEVTLLQKFDNICVAFVL